LLFYLSILFYTFANLDLSLDIVAERIL